MIRRTALQALQGEEHFHWRGGDVSRIEALTDVVFAVSLTLLMVAVEVPKSFQEMLTTFADLPAFIACFAILIWCWYHHFLFHRRFGLENLPVVYLNSLLLLLILVYVYPLKFLFGLLFYAFFRIGDPADIGGGEGAQLMAIYSAGFASIFLVFVGMYAYAWRHREAFGLDAKERHITRATIHSHLLSAGIGIVSLAMTLLDEALTPLAGWVYCLMGPAHGLRGYLTGRSFAKLLEGESGAETSASAKS